jgi:hypothetical protein
VGIRDDRKGRYSGLHTASLAEGLARGRAHHGLTECRALVAWLTATFESEWGRSAKHPKRDEAPVRRVSHPESRRN